jgi:glutamine synthetase
MNDETDAGVTLAQAAAKGRMVEWLTDHGIATVHLGLVDASGTLREKRLGVAAAARAFEGGWSFIEAIQRWGPDDNLWGSGSSGTAAATVDLTSGRPYPFGSAASLFLAEFDPPVGDLSPRHQLGRMVERAAAVGLEARVGWEFECIVLEETDIAGDNPVRAAWPANRCWSASTLAEQAALFDALAAVLAAGDVPLDHLCAELGPGCLELALADEPAARSADSAALAKLYTKAFFAARGQRATFMAQLSHEFPGLGGHPSLSLHSVLNGLPVLFDTEGVMTKTASAAIAGVITLLPELLAMAAPSPNSYRRFGPGNWAPTTATWGIGNYSCALRVVPGNPTHARLELRSPGADVSPHLCLAMFLGAAVWGIEENLEPSPPVPAGIDGRQSGDGGALPRDLTEATDRFEQSQVARELFGSAFVEHFAASRRTEVAACHRFVSAHERARYLDSV